MDDRREIAGLLRPYFPSIPENATSSDWHGFLNAETCLDVALDEPNAVAFDKWRKALADKGMPVWGITVAQEQAIVERGMALKALEDERVAQLPKTLEKISNEAPNVTAADLLK